MRVVIDSVVVVRAIINPDGPSGRLARHADDFVAVMSAETARELIDVVQRPGLQARLHRAGRQPALVQVMRLIQSAEIVDAPSIRAVSRDPDDDKLFAAAVAGRADYIVSEDRDVLDIGEYEGVRTVTVREFLALLGE